MARNEAIAHKRPLFRRRQNAAARARWLLLVGRFLHCDVGCSSGREQARRTRDWLPFQRCHDICAHERAGKNAERRQLAARLSRALPLPRNEKGCN
jgi:hypothetical protein